MTRALALAVAFMSLIALPTGVRPSAAGTGAEARPSQTATAKHPPPRCVIGPVDLAVVPRVSLNALRHTCVRNYLGLALGYGRAGELRGLQIGLGASAVDRSAIGLQLSLGVSAAGDSMLGLQLAGLVTAAGQDGTGVQVAGLVNAAGGDFTGVQVAGLVNASGGHARAIQLALLGNASGGSASVMQVGGLFNASGSGMRGVQVAGLLNATGGDTFGLQVAGLLNAGGGRASAIQVAGLLNAGAQLRGLQVAGAMNAIDSGEGAQVAIGYNRADSEIAGIQIAAVNVGRDVAGAQVGLVNVARRVRGVQLGLVNVADEADAPIGAVSWTRRGDRALEVWSGEALALSAGLRLGARRVYSLAGLSSGPLVDGRPWGPVAGAGVRVPLGRVALMVDALGHALFFDGVDDRALLAQARARVAYDVTEVLALSLGATWNVFVSGDVDGADLPLGLDSVDRSGDTTVRQWPGLTAAVALRW
ncbi:MAG TPA: hypothetical protein VKB80_12110 [Kofleriaceae bacterium]|nr:hypothetical protein [Kofleriaceae bacterium]